MGMRGVPAVAMAVAVMGAMATASQGRWSQGALAITSLHWLHSREICFSEDSSTLTA